MVKRIIWSPLASDTFQCLLVYYEQKTGSKKYSSKLNLQIKSSISRLLVFPFIGAPTQFESVRIVIEGNYKIIYKVTESIIMILMVWDTRQNPENLNLQKFLDGFNDCAPEFVSIFEEKI